MEEINLKRVLPQAWNLKRSIYSRTKTINYLVYCGLMLLCMAVTPLVKAQSSGKLTPLDTIKPGEVWPDEDGNHIQAHGGYEVNLEWKNGTMLRCRIYSPMGTIPQVRYKGRVTVIKTLI